MCTRKAGKDDPDPEDRPKPRAKRHFFLGNKATCSRLKAVNSFYKVNDWVELHEPEFYEAFERKRAREQMKRK